MSTIQTKRLVLRSWQEEDYEPFARLNADPRVMRYFPKMLTLQESNSFAQDKAEHIQKYGWGLWAVALVSTDEFIGFIGLNEERDLFETPVIEIGWRLAFEYWGRGYATEGAKAALEYGFKTLGLNEIFSWTTEENMRSRAVMERIGMHRDSKFDHPRLPYDHPLKRHVRYRITKKERRT